MGFPLVLSPVLSNAMGREWGGYSANVDLSVAMSEKATFRLRELPRLLLNRSDARMTWIRGAVPVQAVAAHDSRVRGTRHVRLSL
jgi:hypothetical protein